MYLGQHGRAAEPRPLFRAAAPVHARRCSRPRCPCPDPTAERTRQRIAARGRRAEPAQPADRLPLPHPLPACHGHVRGGRAADAAARGRPPRRVPLHRGGGGKPRLSRRPAPDTIERFSRPERRVASNRPATYTTARA